ncbi:MAG: flippase-like domain-containing protein [Thermoleophilia bacterium]|nr:flippase-like domain-containing protein [Thermoleophilia bacterium]
MEQSEARRPGAEAGRDDASRRSELRRAARIVLQVAVSGGLLAFLLVQIDLARTADLVGSSHPGYLVGALAIFLATTWLMAWRWQLLLASKGIEEPLGWLTRLYFVGYAAGQVLPTAMGGDAVRILEHARRRPAARAEAAGAVLIERVIGAAGTLVLVAAGLAVAAGRYDDVALLVWIELAGIASVAVLAFLMFSRRTRRVFEERLFPPDARLRLARPLERVHAALHGYREERGALAAALALTLVAQLARMLAIWLCGEAVGLDLSPLVYVILGPILFLVLLVPFTINGLGVREAFFVAFLGRFGVGADAAFATGFLFYAVTVATSIPGGVVLLWRSVRPARMTARTG